MQFKEKTLRELFSESNKVSYIIPEYQRPYEWNTNEKKKRNQVREFWEDLKEFLNSDSQFPLGNIIVLKKGDRYEVVDGQQRLTTAILLIKSIIDWFRQHGYEESANELYKRYILFKEKDIKNIKFQPQEYDLNFWEDFIVNEKNDRNTETPSQQKIKEAKEYFDKLLSKMDKYEEIERIREKLENSILGVIQLNNEKESTSIFELQNDRGKPLTNLDKLKAFFMHQIIICNGTKEDIAYIQREFSDIYKTLNKNFPLDEDEVLLYHIQAHTDFGYNYRNLTELRKRIKDILCENDKRIKYIKNFVRELKESFKAIEKFWNDNKEFACYIKDLTKFKFAFAYPFIIKAYKYFKDKDLEKFLEYLEKIIFVHNITFTRAEIESRLNDFLKQFNKDTNIDDFFMHIYKKLCSEHYWSKETIKNVVQGNMYHDLTRYILKRYEIHLRKTSKENYPEDLICRMDIYSGNENKRTGWWLEHISPQNKNKSGRGGYDIYDEEFKEKYLHSIGNLLLVSDKHNVGLNDWDFPQKLESYKNSLMFHHKEIESIVNIVSGNNIEWKRAHIKYRTDKIINFILNTWNLCKFVENREESP